MADQEDIRVLVTGFGAFRDITTNPSFGIVSRLPETLGHGVGGRQVRVLAHPEPLPAVYKSLLEASPRLIGAHRPDVVVHVGLAAERDFFAVERGAWRDGYHEVPDMDRAVLPRAHTAKALWGKKSADRLDTGIDLDAVLEAWRRNLKAGGGGAAGGAGGKKKDKAKGKGEYGRNAAAVAAAADADVRLSDDVGNYVCGLVYYASLAEMAKSKETAGNVVFLHLPPLPTDEDIQMGVAVVTALIQAIGEVWASQKDA